MSKMTREQAIHILMHLDPYVEYDEDFGMMVRAPLMDAVTMAIKALKAGTTEALHARWEPRADAPGFVSGSNCHNCNVSDDWLDGKKWKYCPECGAKMDLED